MKKFKNKETGAIYIVNTLSIEEAFAKNPIYVEVKETKTKEKKQEIKEEIKVEE